MQTPQFARPRSPNSDLRSPTPCVLDVRSSAFRRLPQCHPRQEPRNTRITRKAEQISNRSPQRKQRQKVVGFAHKHAAPASGLGVSRASCRVLNGPTRLRFELVRAAASPLQARSASKWIRRFGPGFAAAKPHMECGNLLPLSGLQPHATTPVRASPISQLRSTISDALCPRRS